jgi:hypothetical protein
MLAKHGADPVPEPHQLISCGRTRPKKKKRKRSIKRVKGRCQFCHQTDVDLQAHIAANHPDKLHALNSTTPISGIPFSPWVDQRGFIRCRHCEQHFAQSQLREHLHLVHNDTPEAAYTFIRHDLKLWRYVTGDQSS